MCVLYDFRSLSLVSSAINSFGNSIHKHTIRIEKKNIITETKRKCAETQRKSRHQAKFRRKNLIPRLHFVECVCVFFFFILIAYGVNIHKCIHTHTWSKQCGICAQFNVCNIIRIPDLPFLQKQWISILNRIHALHSELNYFIYGNVDALQEWNEN